MKLHRYRFAPLAERDLESIQDVLADQYPERDSRFMVKLDKTIEQLRLFPEMGRPFEALNGYRVVLVWDFTMFYRILENVITIERVLHGARDIEAAFFED
jgi:toxin ParE1/3/4